MWIYQTIRRSTCHYHVTQWAGLDSNQRKLTLMGLQPIPFNHSGTDPKIEDAALDCNYFEMSKIIWGDEGPDRA